jgi:L-2-hydroxyglutarate oxidase
VGEVKSKDVLIIGGGLIGLATAYQLLRKLPHLRLALLEKQSRLVLGQSARLPGVLQSGIWSGTAPGLGQDVSREGRRSLERFCDEEGVPWKRSGKLLVATGEEEAWLQSLCERAEAASISAEWWGPERLKERVPGLRAAAGLFLPEAGMVDYAQICERLVQRVHEMGGEFVGNAEVTELRQSAGRVQVESRAGSFEGKVLFNCSGMQADELTRRAGSDPGIWLVPFRAEFFELDAEGRRLIHLPIYRVPRPGASFGGLRLLPNLDGRVECGPGIRPTISREERPGWWRRWRILAAQVNDPGFVPMVHREWRDAVRLAWRRSRGGGVIEETRVLFPDLESWHFDAVSPGRFACPLRPDGSFDDSLRVVRDDRMIHVCHVPESARTAALTLAKNLAGQAVIYLLD